MNKISKNLTFLMYMCFLVVFTSYLSSFNVLNLSFGSKSVGLGGNICGLPEDIENIYYNPAGLVGINPFELKLMYFNWIAGIDIFDFLIAKSFKDKSALGMSLNYIFTQLESERGNSDYYSILNNLTYARKLNKTYIGIGVTTLYESVSTEENNNLALGLNLGILLRFQRFSFGGCVRNLGQSFITMGDDLFVLPTNLNFGASYIMSNNAILISNLKYDLNGFLSFNTGIEVPLYIGVRENVSIRIGNILNLVNENEIPINFRFGLGFRKEGLKIDYSFVPLGEIGFFHYLSLGFMFY